MKVKKKLTAMLMAGMVCFGAADAGDSRSEYNTANESVRPLGWMVQSEQGMPGYALDQNPATVYQFEILKDQMEDQTPEIVFYLEGQTISEVWIRNGDQRAADTYQASSRIREVMLAAKTRQGEETFSFELNDEFSPNLQSLRNESGYQCILLPTAWEGVQRLEIWIRSLYPKTGAVNTVCVTDIALIGRTTVSDSDDRVLHDSTGEDDTLSISGGETTLQRFTRAYYGPGTDYTVYPQDLPAGLAGVILAREGEYVQFSFLNPKTDSVETVWIPASAITEE